MPKRQSLFMETTEVSVEKTSAEITALLMRSGARSISLDMDDKRKITGLHFVLLYQNIPLTFALPVRTEPIFKIINGRRNYPGSHATNDRIQSEKVAWRQLLRWLQAQLAMIDCGMVQSHEVFLPYMVQPGSSQTLFEHFTQSGFKQLTAATGETNQMQVATLNVTQETATAALKSYKEHRNIYDERDREIERVYRAISKGRKVISVNDSITQAGVDEKGRPHLAICKADATDCVCEQEWSKPGKISFGTPRFEEGSSTRITSVYDRLYIPWTFEKHMSRCVAKVPRVPPQFRPAKAELHSYHILWEANWVDLPIDPILLKRIGKDAWVVLAAWDLTPVEMNVLRAHR